MFDPDVEVRRDIQIPVDDGVSLRADLYLPGPKSQHGGPWPVILEYIPYRKDDVVPSSPTYRMFPAAGYVVARVDARGSGASPGVTDDEYREIEQIDGARTVEWLAAQAWSNGCVVTTGISYGGFTALQIAARAPNGLVATVPFYFTDDRYADDSHYNGGCLNLYYDIAVYGTMMVSYNALPPSLDHDGDWAGVWAEHLDGNEPYLLRWLENQVDGDYWRTGSVGAVAHQIECPVLLFGGWRDGYPNPPLRLFEHLDVPKKVIIGPWDHRMPDEAVPGPQIDYVHEMLAWLDPLCRPELTAPQANSTGPIVVYMQRSSGVDPDRVATEGHWRDEDAWPPLSRTELVFFLSDTGELTATAADPGIDLLVYHPAVGLFGGGLWSGGLPFGLTSDQRLDDALSLTYTTSPFTGEVSILGQPRAEIELETTASVLAVRAVLSDVAPDGTSELITKGILNLTRRKTFIDPSPVRPGVRHQVAIDLDCTGWILAAGHRLRLSIANADIPNSWPTPETATTRLYRGRGTASRLVLPVVDNKAPLPESVFGRAPTPAPIPHRATAHPPVWRVSHDLLAGTWELDVRYEDTLRTLTGEFRDREFEGRFVVDGRDPSRVSATGRHVSRLRGPGTAIESDAHVIVRSTRSKLHVVITLEVQANEGQVFRRSWTRTIERHLL